LTWREAVLSEPCCGPGPVLLTRIQNCAPGPADRPLDTPAAGQNDEASTSPSRPSPGPRAPRVSLTPVDLLGSVVAAGGLGNGLGALHRLGVASPPLATPQPRSSRRSDLKTSLQRHVLKGRATCMKGRAATSGRFTTPFRGGNITGRPPGREVAVPRNVRSTAEPPGRVSCQIRAHARTGNLRPPCRAPAMCPSPTSASLALTR
jgi:hypothetical protein